MFTYLSGAVNSDSLANLVAAALASHVASGILAGPVTRRCVVVLGVILGLGLLAKPTITPAVVACSVALVRGARARRAGDADRAAAGRPVVSCVDAVRTRGNGRRSRAPRPAGGKPQARVARAVWTVRALWVPRWQTSCSSLRFRRVRRKIVRLEARIDEQVPHRLAAR
jgi:hypothetical protein